MNSPSRIIVEIKCWLFGNDLVCGITVFLLLIYFRAQFEVLIYPKFVGPSLACTVPSLNIIKPFYIL